MMEIAAIISIVTIFLLFWLTLVIGLILCTIFWIVMLVDAARREYKNQDDKILWILVIALTGIIGAGVYYFVVKRKN